MTMFALPFATWYNSATCESRDHGWDPDPDEQPDPIIDVPGWAVNVDRITLPDTNVAVHPIGFQRRWPQVWPAPEVE